MTRQHPNRRQGTFAEETVAREFDLEHVPEEADWYDCVNPRNGTKYEVKSTHREVADGSTGRFRLWADQHRSLVAAASNDGMTAWYAFVLLEGDGQVAEVRRVKVSTVTEIVGGWNRAGHAKRDGPQNKLVWTEVLDE